MVVRLDSARSLIRSIFCAISVLAVACSRVALATSTTWLTRSPVSVVTHAIAAAAVHKLGNGSHLPVDGQGGSRAGLFAIAAAGAFDRSIHEMLAPVGGEFVDIHRAGRDTGTMPRASVLLVHDLELPRLAFRVRAPLAAQGASLEKHHGADPGAVVHVVFLDVEDEGFSFDHFGLFACCGARFIVSCSSVCAQISCSTVRLMISSCTSLHSSTKNALYPATRTTRSRYFSGCFWASRSTSLSR